MQKVQKLESVNNEQKRTDSSSVFKVKNEQAKRKQTRSVSFVKVFKFQEHKFKMVHKNFLGIIIEVSWKNHQSR